MSSSEKFMQLNTTFGVNRNATGNVFFLPFKNTSTIKEQGDQTIIAHVSGNCLVLGNLSNEKDKYITPGSISKGITCVKVFEDNKYFCVACRGESNPLMLFYDTIDYQIKKVLQVPDVGSKEIICVDRSNDNRVLIAQGGAPDYRLSIWFFHDALKIKKTVGALDVIDNEPEKKVFHASVNHTGKFICVTGDKLFRLYKVEEGKIIMIRKELNISNSDSQCFMSHLWLTERDDRLIIATKEGNLYFFEDNDLKMLLNCSPANHLCINCLISFEKSFACGGEDGYLNVFDRTEDPDMFKKSATIKLPNPNQLFTPDDLSIVNMHMDDFSGNVVCSTKAGQIYHVQLSGGALQFKTGEFEIDHLFPYHSSNITDVSVSIKKPFIVTSSLDNTIRIIDYHSMKIRITKKFQMESHSISIHPMGFYLLVGFTDKLRYFKILGDDLREEISYHIRNCQCVKFSNGGHMFAAVHGTSVNVYDSYTYNQKYSLRNAHTGKISHFDWDYRDTYITSVDLNGNVVQFQLNNETKVWDDVLIDCSLSNVVCNKKSTFVVGNDSMIHVFVEHVRLNKHKTDKYYFTSLELTDNNRLLYGGKVDGSIFIYSQNNIDEVKEKFFYQSGAIKKIIATYKGAKLVSISEDGSLCLFDIREKDKEYNGRSGESSLESMNVRSRGEKMLIDEWDEEILISKTDLQAKHSMIKELEIKCQDLVQDNEYNQIKKQLEYNALLKKQSDSFQEELKKKKERIKELENELKEKKKKYEIKKKENVEKNKKEMTELEYQYNERIHDTLNTLKEIEESKKVELNDLDMKVKADEEEHLTFFEESNKKYDNELRDWEMKIKDMEKKLGEFKVESEKEIEDVKVSNLKNINKIEDEYTKKFYKTKKEKKKLKKENMEKSSSQKHYGAKIENLKSQIQSLHMSLEKKEKEFVQKERYTKSIEKENRERENTISEKEHTIMTLTKQNKDLQKFKFVLSHKIKTLEEEIAPNNRRIENMESELEKYDSELSKYEKIKEKYSFTIADLERKLIGAESHLDELRGAIKKEEEHLSFLKREILNLTENIEDDDSKNEEKKYKDIKTRVIDLYQKSLTDGKDIKKESNRRVIYLEKTVDNLKKKLVKAKKTTSKETSRIMNENVILLNEINNLRKELRFLQRRSYTKKSKNPTKKLERMNSIDEEQARRILEMQKIELNQLRNKLNQLELELKG